MAEEAEGDAAIAPAGGLGGRPDRNPRDGRRIHERDSRKICLSAGIASGHGTFAAEWGWLRLIVTCFHPRETRRARHAELRNASPFGFTHAMVLRTGERLDHALTSELSRVRVNGGLVLKPSGIRWAERSRSQGRGGGENGGGCPYCCAF